MEFSFASGLSAGCNGCSTRDEHRTLLEHLQEQLQALKPPMHQSELQKGISHRKIPLCCALRYRHLSTHTKAIAQVTQQLPLVQNAPSQCRLAVMGEGWKGHKD